MAQSPGSQEQANFLGGCLVESDSEFEKRARKIKRRALVASIIFQILVVAALVLFPLLGKGESIATYAVTPSIPYHHGTVPNQHQHTTHRVGARRTVCFTCIHQVQPLVNTHEHFPAPDPVDEIDNAPPGSPVGENIPGLPDSFVVRREPDPPRPVEHARPRTLQVSAGVQQARLIHRVEPVYPFLPKSIHREGRVELRAIIATDGRIKWLQVVSGDPMFIQSALSAVQDWRYQPTLLNNEPVEVETYIIVTYTLAH